jgi:RNase_H superfamily
MFIRRKPLVVCDIESSPNAYLVGFKSIEKGTVIQIGVYGEDESLTSAQIKKLRGILSKYTIITFNGNKYDMPVILKSLEGITCNQIFKMGSTIIEKNIPSWLSMKTYGIDWFQGLIHIDLTEPAPGVMVSLKMYGARLHSQKLQDLPYAFDKYLTPEEYDVWAKYNVNDLDTTIDLYNEIQKSIELRYNVSDHYKLDLMSKGDAQIAEVVLIQTLSEKGIRANKVSLGKNYHVKYKSPKGTKFVSDELQELLTNIEAEEFVLDKGGKPQLPKWLSKPFVIGTTKYKVGLGGLHSQEKKLVSLSDENYIMRNADVASYYPSMIIEFDYSPKQFGKDFLEVYTNFYWDRNHPVTGSKVRGDKVSSDMVKLILNGIFGKLGSKWSKLYAPDLMLQVTLSGQLLLLMLIEQLELKGFQVVSSNTDGIEYRCEKSRQDEAEAIIYDWELDTGMVMEHGVYTGLYARDVNNYVAVYDKYAKAKGAYTEANIKKNAEYIIVFEAIKKYLLDETPLEDTINKCEDVREFIICRNAAGGGVWREEYLGKVVRWYYSTDGDPILYKKNGNKVAKSDGAKPIMDLPVNNEIPKDLDKDFYIELAIKHLGDLGIIYDKYLYECMNCDYVGNLSTFDDTECDGDVLGTCPCCKNHTVILEVQNAK